MRWAKPTLRRRLRLQEERVVNDPGEDCAGDGADPVDVVVLPEVGDEGGAEGAGWVHGRAGEGTTEEDVHGDGQADGQAGGCAAAAGIDAGAENHEDEEEGEEGFDDDAGGDGSRFGKLGSSTFDDALGEKRAADRGGGNRAGQLRDDVGDAFARRDFAGDYEGNADGGVELAAGNVEGGGDHDGDGKA